MSFDYLVLIRWKYRLFVQLAFVVQTLIMSTLIRSRAFLEICSPLSAEGSKSGSIVMFANEPAASPLTILPGLMQITPSIY